MSCENNRWMLQRRIAKRIRYIIQSCNPYKFTRKKKQKHSPFSSISSNPKTPKSQTIDTQIHNFGFLFTYCWIKIRIYNERCLRSKHKKPKKKMHTCSNHTSSTHKTHTQHTHTDLIPIRICNNFSKFKWNSNHAWSLTAVRISY